MTDRPSQTTAGAFWNSGKAKTITVAICAVVGLFVFYRAVKSDPKEDEKNSAPRSQAAKALERMKGTHQNKLDQEATGSKDMKTASDQPTGDPAATRALADLETKKEQELAKRKAAEDAVRASVEYIQFQRKLQGLSYDASLASAWEARIEAARAAGVAAPLPPPPPSKESVQIVRDSNPQLAKALDGANSVTISVKGGAAPGKGAPVNAQVQGGGGGLSADAAAGLDGIDPATGLPRSAVGGHGGPGGFSALLPDGTPDLEGGAVPIQVQYTPPGSSQPITITRWVRPGYLSGRSRPYDPRDLVMEDQAYRQSMKASTDLPEDKVSQAIRIPVRMGTPQTKVHSNDFVYKNRHVVVVPNPDQGGTR